MGPRKEKGVASPQQRPSTGPCEKKGGGGQKKNFSGMEYQREGEGWASMEEVRAALLDPRYVEDFGFREEVEKKLRTGGCG
jgi:hypothetical protein